jgi:iron complex transport system substrate-binding protein
MRILGIQWLTHCLYPDRFPLDLPAETQKFYRLFLRIDLDDTALGGLIQ